LLQMRSLVVLQMLCVTDITCNALVLSERREFRVGQLQGAPENRSSLRIHLFSLTLKCSAL
jgi:hypothetical protein